ncbi:MAG TPA: anti-sigma factor [Candidatus Binatus sp.]|nr:anti-sigma factor [Candidatus Binatus sp.]
MADDRMPPLSCAEVEDLAAGFVLGSLPDAEMAAVRGHLATCTSDHPALAELASVVPALALAVPEAKPAAALGGRILAAARAEVPAREVLSPPPAREPAVRGENLASDRRVVARRDIAAWLRPFRRPAWGLAALAAVLVLVLTALDLQLTGQVSELTAYRAGVEAVLSAAASPGGRLAILNSAATGGPAGLAAVTVDGRVSIAMRNLVPTTGDEVYEAWLIPGSAAPLPVGSFAVGSGQTGTLLASLTNPVADTNVVVAVTREPGPGATTPTLPIIAQGRASPPAS